MLIATKTKVNKIGVKLSRICGVILESTFSTISGKNRKVKPTIFEIIRRRVTQLKSTCKMNNILSIFHPKNPRNCCSHDFLVLLDHFSCQTILSKYTKPIKIHKLENSISKSIISDTFNKIDTSISPIIGI